MGGGMMRARRYELRHANMAELVATAWSVEPDHVVGGPGWLEMDRFEVIARTPVGSTSEPLRLMLRTLLADRFGLVIHNDRKPLPAYVLAVGKRPQLKESVGLRRRRMQA
jgi:uncharacterized protein (TIGR03435 family)